MGILRRERDEVTIHLPVDALAGRSDAHDIRLTHESTSLPHAILRWAPNNWQLRDLGSRNGTYVGNHLVEPGRLVTLRRGTTIRFGTEHEAFTLIDCGPPVPLARHLASGRTVAMGGGLLVLPDDNNPIASIYEGREALQMEIDMAPRLGRTIDREVIMVAGECWQLRTATTPALTTSYVSMPIPINAITLRLSADPAWTNIVLTIIFGSDSQEIRHYAHHELLLLLANERVGDADREVADDEAGWIEVVEVAKRLAGSVAVVNSLVHKVRGRFRAAKVVPPAAIVERRPGQMRIGVANIELLGAAALGASSTKGRSEARFPAG